MQCLHLKCRGYTTFIWATFIIIIIFKFLPTNLTLSFFHKIFWTRIYNIPLLYKMNIQWKLEFRIFFYFKSVGHLCTDFFLLSKISPHLSHAKNCPTRSHSHNIIYFFLISKIIPIVKYPFSIRFYSKGARTSLTY